MKKFLSVLLSLTMLFLLSAETIALESSDDYKFLNDVNPDTVVCYYMGVPVKASDVNSYGLISQDVVQKAKMVRRANMWDMRISSSNHGKVINVAGTLSAPSYSQDQRFIYLPNDDVMEFAAAMGSSGTQDIVTCLIGLLPYGYVFSVGLAVNSFMEKNAKADIINMSNDGKNVMFNQVHSNYGNFFAYDEWDGWTIAGTEFDTGVSTWEVDKILYK